MSSGPVRLVGRVSLGALCLSAFIVHGQTLERQGVANILGANEEVRSRECSFVIRNEDREGVFNNRRVVARYSTLNGVVSGAKMSLCAAWDARDGDCDSWERGLAATADGTIVGSAVGDSCISFGRLFLGRGLFDGPTGDGGAWGLRVLNSWYDSVVEVTDQEGRGDSFPETERLRELVSDFTLANSSSYTGIYELRGFFETGIGVLVGILLVWAGGATVARLSYGAVGLGQTLYAHDGTYAQYTPRWYVDYNERIAERFAMAGGFGFDAVGTEEATAGGEFREQDARDRALTAQARLARSEGELDPDKYSSERDSESEADRIGRRARWGRGG